MILGVDALNLAADRRGMGRYVRLVLRGLKSLEIQFRLIAPGPVSGEDAKFAADWIALPDLPKTHLDAVWYPWNGIRFKAPAPSIVSIYDAFAFTFPAHNLIARWREQRPIRRAARTADRVTTISRWSAQQLHVQLDIPPDSIAVLSPVIDSFWHRVPSDSAKDAILFVAGPEERKNARFLFAAFDHAFADRSVELIVIGKLNPPDAAAFKKMRGRRRHISADDARLRELYSSALAVAVPSFAEGYGMPVIEAMACGAPVIAANAAALPEAADGAALMVQPNDYPAWIAALQRITRDRQLQEDLRRAGFARIAKLDPCGPAKGIASLAQELR